MDKNWKQHFPYPEPRPDQPDVIEKILNAFDGGKKFAIIEAPTGTGKSAIGYTIGRCFDDYWYVTAQKILQSQLSEDFGENGRWADQHPMIELKGRNSYSCDYYEAALNDEEHPPLSDDQIKRFRQNIKDKVDCSKGECKRKGRSKLSYCDKNNICPYFNQVSKAVYSPAVLMNFHSFIFQTEFVPDRWPQKTLLIIDEAHNVEQVLMDFVSFKITDASDWMPNLPKYTSSEEYLIFFEEIGMEDILKEKLSEALSKGDSDEEEYWGKQLSRYQNFKNSMNEHEWIPQYEEKSFVKGKGDGSKRYREVELKPLYISDFADDLLFNKVDYILMMSATILSVDIMCESLGINRSEVYAKRIGSDFPVENRPIYYEPSGNMSFKEKDKTIPKMMKDIERISKKHDNVKGIIHTHNFAISKYIKDNASEDLKMRLFFQEDFDSKESMLAIHSKSDDGIIVAPAMHEGLDLKNDLSRFQIICKVPYPGLGNNPQLKKRMDISPDYYTYLTSLKLVQQYGRSIRSNTDYADTYILDGGFKSYFHRAKSMMPKWFVDAIVW